jgi:hypothetical protein
MQSRGCHLDRMAAAFGRAKTRLWLEIKASIYDCPILAPRRAGVWCARLGDACGPRGWAFFRTSSQWFLSSSGMMARSRRASLVGAIPEDAIIGPRFQIYTIFDNRPV